MSWLEKFANFRLTASKYANAMPRGTPAKRSNGGRNENDICERGSIGLTDAVRE
jgi:hypothetical protein